MLFNTFVFAVFFPLVWGVYWGFLSHNRKLQNGWLLLASLVFYGWWDPRFLGLLLFSALVDFGVALALEQTGDSNKRKGWMAISLIANLGVLFFFKYFGFFTESLSLALQPFGIELSPITLKIILPVGISFYTFQTLSYTIDVYRKQLTATRDLVAFLAFISFFPQLVAGPIERAANLLPQFFKNRNFDYAKSVSGLRYMLWGFFKKIVIADGLGVIADICYKSPENYGGAMLLVATLAFCFQIYCDFSGYSDIAIGTARMLGFELMTNFDTPYFATSLQDFWRRWHISLSTWFRDYVYIPLGGNRSWAYRNLLLTFLLSGLWHGANWTYIIWGALHGMGLCIEILVRKNFKFSLPNWITGLLTFGIVLLGWVFFRAKDLPTALLVLHKILDFSQYQVSAFLPQLIQILGNSRRLFFLVLMFALFFLIEMKLYRPPLDELLEQYPRPVRWGVYYLIVLCILLFGAYTNAPTFIYFQF